MPSAVHRRARSSSNAHTPTDIETSPIAAPGTPHSHLPPLKGPELSSSSFSSAVPLSPPMPQQPQHATVLEGPNRVYNYLDNAMSPTDLAFFNSNLALPENSDSQTPWTPVLSTHNINVDKCKTVGGAITAIRGVSKLKGVHPDAFYKHLTDPFLMKGWMANLLSAKIVPSTPSLDVSRSDGFTQTHDVIYTTYRYPGILSNRDALSSRSLLFDPTNGRRMIMWRSTHHPDFPLADKFIRTWTFGCYLVCDDPEDKDSCLYYSFGMVDARGWLPDWFVTQFCPTGIKDLCKRVRSCCIKYQEMHELAANVQTPLELAIKRVESCALGEDSDGGVLSDASVLSDDARSAGGESKKAKKKRERKEKVTKFLVKLAMGGGAGMKLKMGGKGKSGNDEEIDLNFMSDSGDDGDADADADADEDEDIYSDTFSGDEFDESKGKRKKSLRKSIGGKVDELKSDYKNLKQRMVEANSKRKEKVREKKQKKKEEKESRAEQRELSGRRLSLKEKLVAKLDKAKIANPVLGGRSLFKPRGGPEVDEAPSVGKKGGGRSPGRSGLAISKFKFKKREKKRRESEEKESLEAVFG